MQRQILHVDVNNAFLSWTAIERLRQGEVLDIRTIPAIIGGDETSRHGIVLAKSMKAKQFGIKTGEPIYQARKKCPKVQVFQGDFEVYHKNSKALYKILSSYTEKMEAFSIDECFLDLTDYLQGKEKILQKAYEIKQRIKEELGFTVNVGVSSNKLLAKMASDLEKPDKVHTLYPEEIPTKMWNLPASELFMVGKKTIEKLQTIGVQTIGDIAKLEDTWLIRKFGKYGKLIKEYANGIDYAEVLYEPEAPKGIGNSITLPEDIKDMNKLEEILLALAEQVGFRLRNYQLEAQVIQVQIRTNQFINYSHQKKLDHSTDVTKEIYEQAKQLLKHIQFGRSIRLIGLRVDQLSTKKETQLSLFHSKQIEKQEKIDLTLDDIKKKYGYHIITRAGELPVNHFIQVRKEKRE